MGNHMQNMAFAAVGGALSAVLIAVITYQTMTTTSAVKIVTVEHSTDTGAEVSIMRNYAGSFPVSAEH